MNLINRPIKPHKEQSWHYKSHPYFTKQAANVVSAYIEHYSKPGDLILDPFGGTGVTAIEALRLKRKAVIIDINPLACFMIKQTCKKVDINTFIQIFNDIEKNVKIKIDNFFQISNDELAKESVEHWFPKDILLPKNSDFDLVEDLYTPRQLHSLALLYDEINTIDDPLFLEIFKYVFSSTIAKVNLTFMPSEKDGKQVGGGGPAIFGKYRYWRPKTPREVPVWENFKARFNQIRKGKEKWNEFAKDIDIEQNLSVINGSALSISEYIPKNSIDYIYTDPPYGGNIAYLDLSTMWNAWLFPEIFTSEGINKLKKEEIIEGGDLYKSQDEYSELFAKSFEEMGKVLKKDGWMSCVFAHKKLEFWNTIVDSCEENGMEFMGSTYQPTNNSSIHYKKNPANVLCSQRIANFKKTFNKAVRPKPDNLLKFILNEMEQTIVLNKGAGIDTIYQHILDKLLETKSMGEAKKKGYLALDKYLSDDSKFTFDQYTNLYYLRKKSQQNSEFEQQYLAHLDQVRIYLKEIFAKKRSLTIDKIHKELFEIFAVDKRFPIEKDLPLLLDEIAYKSPKTGNWIIKRGEAVELDLDLAKPEKLIKVQSEGFSHSEIIFRLSVIGEYLGYAIWIGKREQAADSFQNIKLSSLSLPDFPLKHIKENQQKKVEQIDIIWFDKLGVPRFAFEVEESTSIVSGFERFMNLLDVQPDIAKKLYIVAPKSRIKKLTDVFLNSTYVGHPIYLENKVNYMFKEDLAEFYDSHTDEDFDESDLKKITFSFVDN